MTAIDATREHKSVAKRKTQSLSMTSEKPGLSIGSFAVVGALHRGRSAFLHNVFPENFLLMIQREDTHRSPDLLSTAHVRATAARRSHGPKLVHVIGSTRSTLLQILKRKVWLGTDALPDQVLIRRLR